jgi:hypothetical protein
MKKENIEKLIKLGDNRLVQTIACSLVGLFFILLAVSEQNSTSQLIKYLNAMFFLLGIAFFTLNLHFFTKLGASGGLVKNFNEALAILKS